MFTTYRVEDDPKRNGLEERIAAMVKKQGDFTDKDVMINWEACLPNESVYSALIDTEDDFIGFAVRKQNDTITVKSL